jgi:hypothetical protein
MQCPKCQSQDVYLCSTAYAQGTMTTETDGDYSGIGMNAGGATQYLGSGSHSSTHQTAFARDASPPESKHGKAIGIVIGAFLWNIVCALLAWGTEPPYLKHSSGFFYAWWNYEWVWLRWLNIVLLIAAIWWLRSVNQRMPEYNAALERWRKTWICKRCGTKFVPDENAA